MNGVLDAILETKRAEIATLGPVQQVFAPRVDAWRRLARPAGAPMRLVAEHKRRSPSAGPLSTVLAPGARALAYARAGASMISVLCDARFFDGSYAHLEEARRTLDALGLDTPLLAKEFVLDPRQIAHAAARGADAVLLIVRIVDEGALVELVAASRDADLEPLVEVTNEEEVDRALAAGARFVGVNARDLDTLVMDGERAARVLARLPGDVVAVHLSGLAKPEDVRRVAGGRADAALVGEALMRADDPGPLLASMVAAARQT